MRINEITRNRVQKTGNHNEPDDEFSDYTRTYDYNRGIHIQKKKPADQLLPGKKLPIVIDNYGVYYKKYSRNLIVTVFDQNTKIAYLELKPSRFLFGLNFYHVETARVRNEYQGRGIGEALYTGLITLCDVNLYSAGSHSPGARKMWMRLSENSKISTWAIDYHHCVHKTISNNRKQELYLDKNKPAYGKVQALALTKKNSIVDKRFQQIFNDQDSADVLGTDFSKI
jgi:hypothetical protein